MTPAVLADQASKNFAAPVSVQVCQLDMAWGPPMAPAAPGPLVQGVSVKFVNDASIAATSVVFKVTYNGRTDTIVDKGKFSPGVPIVARFNNFARLDYWRPEPDACSLAEVDFADGTVWRPAAKSAK
ncbi:MAG: hypothetical protein ACRENA_10950 [Vulcanimicrobiaceae bacterium]